MVAGPGCSGGRGPMFHSVLIFVILIWIRAVIFLAVRLLPGRLLRLLPTDTAPLDGQEQNTRVLVTTHSSKNRNVFFNYAVDSLDILSELCQMPENLLFLSLPNTKQIIKHMFYQVDCKLKNVFKDVVCRLFTIKTTWFFYVYLHMFKLICPTYTLHILQCHYCTWAHWPHSVSCIIHSKLIVFLNAPDSGLAAFQIVLYVARESFSKLL